MKITSGLFQEASDIALDAVSEASVNIVRDPRFISSIVSCSSETSSQLGEIHKLMAGVSQKLSSLKDSASSLEVSQLRDLVEGAASQVGSNIAARGVLLSQQATSAGISYATKYVQKKIGLAALALEIIQNSSDVVYAGVMALILLRIESRLKTLRESVLEINIELQKVVRGVKISQEVFQTATSDITQESFQSSVMIIKNAERKLGLAYAVMENEGGLSSSMINEASSRLNLAIKELSQGEDLLSAILGSGLASEIASNPEKFISKENSWNRVQDAIHDNWGQVEDAIISAKKIPGLLKSAANAYSDAKKWIGYAKNLPDSIKFTASSSIKDAVLLELTTIREKLMEVVLLLEKENAGSKERIQGAHQLNLMRIRLANLLLFSTREISEIKNEWYEDIQEIINHPLWGEETLASFNELEVSSLLGSSYSEINSTASGPYDWSLKAQQVGTGILRKISSLESLSKKLSDKLKGSTLGPWSIAEGYLKSVGVSDPLLALVSGDLPTKIEKALDTALSIKKSYQAGRFSKNKGIPCIEESRSGLPPNEADNAEIMLVNDGRISQLKNQDMFNVIQESYLVSSQREILAERTVAILTNN